MSLNRLEWYGLCAIKSFCTGTLKNENTCSGSRRVQTFDKFHIMKIINEAVDEVRRQEQKERPELARTRYIWLKN